MSAKRALVVDDSKSARAFLSRILERHEIAVDAAESAEAAIEYLARNKPDVIFMDHMMPGMDGFQAVQTIKNNPRTSAIPILMYTSQEGDLYLGQARALGAEGVLPKQIKQSDVTKMLYQLQLVADRRAGEQTTFARMAADAGLLPANESAIVVTPAPAPPVAGDGAISNLLPQMSLEIRAALEGSLQKELVALRSFIASTLDSHAERVDVQLSAALKPAVPAPALDLPTLLPERRSRAAAVGWSLTVLAAAGAAVMSWLWWQQGGEIAALRTDLDAAYAEVESLRARPPVVSEAPVAPLPDAGGIVLPAVDSAAVAPDANSPVASTGAADLAAVSAAMAPAPATAEPTAAAAPPVQAPAASVPAAAPAVHQAQ